MASPGYTATQTYGAWGPPPSGTRPPRRTRALAGAGLAILACGGIAAAVLLPTPGAAHRSAPATVPNRADPAGVRRAVIAVSAIVARSAADRTRVINAIDGVQSCTVVATEAESSVQSVIDDRRQALASLGRFAGVRVQVVTSLVSELTTTLNASISDDESYMSWMSDVASGHASCAGNPASDPNFAAAQAESSRTNTDKAQFVGTWNSLAPRYGQQTYRAEDF